MDALSVVEAAAARAWPPTEARPLGPWTLRAAFGVTRRANSVQVPASGGRPAPADLPGLVTEAEAFYRDRRAPARFQLCGEQGELAGHLSGRGYAVETRSVLETAPLGAVVAAGPEPSRTGWAVAVVDALDDRWLDAFLSVETRRFGLGEATCRRVYRSLLRPAAPVAYARAVPSPAAGPSAPAAVGQCVLDGSWAGIQCMATAPPLRRRGGAGAVLRALAAWALGRGATDAYLAVEPENAPALGLYRAHAFSVLESYEYRRLAV